MFIQVQMPESARFLTPAVVDQVRLGSKNDGGYVTPTVAWNSNTSLISMGINDDWNFELHLSRLISGGKTVCVDPTISSAHFLSLFIKSLFLLFEFRDRGLRRRLGLVKLRSKTLLSYLLFFSNPNRKHIKKWGQISGNRNSISITEAVKLVPRETELLIKLDIEGDEFALLEEYMTSIDFPRTRAFFVEFHEISENWNQFSEIVKNLQFNYTVTHFHANNCVRELGKNGLPRFVEMTFLRNDLVASSGLQLFSPIIEVDSPNKLGEPDFKITFA